MRKIITLFFVFLFVNGAAQPTLDGSGFTPLQDADTLVQESTSSSIDLLKQSLKSSNPPASDPATQPAPQEQPVPAPAVKPEQAPAKPSAAVSGGDATTLELPLEMGGSVKTVQTVVEPAPKKVSPKAAKRIEASKKKRKSSPKKVSKPATRPAPTDLEKDIEKANALLPPAAQTVAGESATPEPESDSEEAAADAELEYAVRMLEKSREKAESAERKIPPSASKNRPNKVPAPNKKFNPNAFRPGVTWVASKSTHFDIYTEKRTSGVGSANMGMLFESSYQTLRRFIPWMMSGKVRVFVYQDHQSYLRHEPNAQAWTRALAYPTRGEIVVYDEPGKSQELKEVFTHELTHIFTQQFFDKHNTGRIMTPTWLDEGLAVYMEDHAYNGRQGGPWNHDFKTINFQRDPSQSAPSFSSKSMFGSSGSSKSSFGSKRKGPPLYFTPFEAFMQEGSLQSSEGRGKTQDWYFQAYTMVRFLLNPAGGTSPSNRMQFEQFTRLLAQGEALRDPSTGFLVKDSRGKTVYQPYSVEKALGRAYRYGTIANFEDNFWRWASR